MQPDWEQLRLCRWKVTTETLFVKAEDPRSHNLGSFSLSWSKQSFLALSHCLLSVSPPQKAAAFPIECSDHPLSREEASPPHSTQLIRGTPALGGQPHLTRNLSSAHPRAVGFPDGPKPHQFPSHRSAFQRGFP